MAIYSDLGTEQKEELGVGAKTTFLTRHNTNEPSVPGSESPGSESGARPSSHSPSEPAFATLRYADLRGEKMFAMTREEIVIGRGGMGLAGWRFAPQMVAGGGFEPPTFGL